MSIRGRWPRVWWGGVAVVVAAFAIQLVPYGRSHSNPPVTRDAPWPTAEARQLAVAACYDCHSNRTQWRWYSDVAPISWYIQNHVDEGRGSLNFSEWDQRQRTDELAESVREGDMPPSSYTRIHSGARLSPKERAALAKALAELPAPGR
jgi:hypothetical protein